MQKITIWHNPRCSKSRRALEILHEHELEPTVRLYLDDPPHADEIAEVLRWLDIAPESLMRTQEDAYQEAGLDDEALSLDEQLEKLALFPRVMERPVVFVEGRAIVARPPEQLVAWLQGL